jgi:hypothetical protein
MLLLMMMIIIIIIYYIYHYNVFHYYHYYHYYYFIYYSHNFFVLIQPERASDHVCGAQVVEGQPASVLHQQATAEEQLPEPTAGLSHQKWHQVQAGPRGRTHRQAGYSHVDTDIAARGYAFGL